MAIVTADFRDHVTTITISRPDRRNALNHDGLDELHEIIKELRLDQPRAVVLTGSDGHFCSGADLMELEDLAFTRALRRMLDDFIDIPVVTIAAISGSCMGLGMQLASACDLRIGAADAQFALPVAKLGLMVDHLTIQRVTQTFGQSMTRWMLLTAERVNAERAYTTAFLHELVDNPLTRATELAANIATLAPLALSGSKQGINALERSPEELDPDGEFLRSFEKAWKSADLEEGRNAFRERRSPVFYGS